MESGVTDREFAEALDAAGSAVDALFASGVEPVNSRDAITCIREVEAIRRRVDAVATELMDRIDDRNLYAADGHVSAKVMVAQYGKLSGAEAATRDKARKAMNLMPEVQDAYRAGELGTDQLRVLGRVQSNPRVRHKMRDDQSWFLHRAKRYDFDTFKAKARKWESLVDEDGPTPAAEVTHENRNANLTQDFDTSWNLSGRYASMQGAAMDEIFGKYIEAETLTDWEKAKAEHGEAATYSDLPRSIQQRRADALWQIFQDAASAPHGALGPKYVHNIVWDNDTFEEMARRVAGGEAQPLDPDAFRCETIDGVRLDAHEAFANALNSRIRRVLIDSKSVVIDLGDARFFAGLARHAVMLQFHECVWVGCHIPASRCEADHLVEHSRHGRTNPGNGAPLCGRHNRWKQKGFSVNRDASGQWHIRRPDGTEIPA